MSVKISKTRGAAPPRRNHNNLVRVKAINVRGKLNILTQRLQEMVQLQEQLRAAVDVARDAVEKLLESRI